MKTIPPIYIVAFTGHRSSDSAGRSEADIDSCRNLIADALELIRKQVSPQNGCVHLLSGIAEGSDIAAIEVAQSLDITTHILLPMPEELFKDDFCNDPETWGKISNLLQDARRADTQSTLRIAGSNHERPDCYADANQQTINSADALITIWDGQPECGIGGTAQVWQHAENINMPRVHINPVITQSAAYNLEKLTQDQDDSGSTFYELASELPSPSSDPMPYSLQCHKALDALAITHSQSARSTLLKAIWLHGSASILAALGVSYALANGPQKLNVLLTVSVIEFLLIFYAEYLHHKQHKEQIGEHWINCRFAAELLRPFHFTRSLLDPFSPLIQRHYPQWRRFLISIHFSMPNTEQADLKTARQNYIQNRIDEQLKHFRDKQKAAAPKSRGIYRYIRSLSYSALFAVLLAVIYKVSHIEWFGHQQTAHSQVSAHFNALEFTLYLLPIALPLLAGILLALRQSLDLSRRHLRYQQMITYLEKTQQAAQNAHTMHTFEQLVRETEDTLLDELREFDIAQRIGLQH
jgi:hypothetical protein